MAAESRQTAAAAAEEVTQQWERLEETAEFAMKVDQEAEDDGTTDARHARAVHRWTRVMWRLFRWQGFIQQKLIAVKQIGKLHPRRRSRRDREAIEEAAKRCTHPPHLVSRQGSNASAVVEKCMGCGIRLSYARRDGKNKAKVAEVVSAAAGCVSATSEPVPMASKPVRAPRASASAASVSEGLDAVELETVPATRVKRKGTATTTRTGTRTDTAALEDLMRDMVRVQQEQGESIRLLQAQVARSPENHFIGT